jgi:hypothetical protein
VCHNSRCQINHSLVCKCLCGYMHMYPILGPYHTQGTMKSMIGPYESLGPSRASSSGPSLGRSD